LDDNNNSTNSPNVNTDPNTPFSGIVPAGGTAILIDSSVDPDDFLTAWGSGLNIIPVFSWDGLNNDTDAVGLWDDPNAYAGDHVTHLNTVANQFYDIDGGFGLGLGSGPSIYLGDLSLDPNDGGNWPQAVFGDDVGSFNATGVSGAGGLIPFHDGGDTGSPGVFSVVVEDADFDDDLDVDGDDFLTWQRNAGTTGGTLFGPGDANGDGDVDGGDLAIWENQYGTTLPLQAAAAAVPEPSTLILCGLALAPWGLRRRQY
jgi:hypothetical protein